MKLMDAPSEKFWAYSWISHMDALVPKIFGLLMDSPYGCPLWMPPYGCPLWLTPGGYLINRNYIESHMTIDFHQAFIAQFIECHTSDLMAVSLYLNWGR